MSEPTTAVRAIVQWDYREQPDWGRINLALVEVFDGSSCPAVVLVPDTRGDQYVAVVAGRPFTEQDAQRVYDGTSNPCRFEEHEECSSEDCVCTCHPHFTTQGDTNERQRGT